MSEAQNERKYLLDADHANRFLSAIAPFTAPTIHDPSAPIAWTRTTYLDTPELDCYRSGDGDRSRRLRIREYASAPDGATVPRLTGECWLELKESADSTRVKTRFRAPGEVIAAMIAAGELPGSWEARLDATSASAAFRRKILEGRPAPVLTTWYRRLARAGEAVRVTLDEDLAWAEPCPVGLPGLPAEPPAIFFRLHVCVLEVKSAGAMPDWLREALAGVSPAIGFSKFREGMRRKLQNAAGADGSVRGSSDGSRARSQKSASVITPPNVSIGEIPEQA